MSPSTRSASKRAADPTIPPGPSRRTQDRPYKRAKKGKRAPVNTGSLPCPLLKMPPEIRNRIYDFCTERIFEFQNGPYSLRKTKKPGAVPDYMKSRTFLALSQTCKNIRSEYRPLWLRQSSVCIAFDDIDSFMATFYLVPGSRHTWYLDAPRLVIVTWDHDKEMYVDASTLLNIKPILKLRAFMPSSKIKFVCRKLEERDLGHVECRDCGDCITCQSPMSDCGSDDDSDRDPDTDLDSANELDMVYDYDCSHGDTIDEIIGELRDQYMYLEALNDFLNNSNEAWLEAVGAETQYLMAVHCTVGSYHQAPTLYIRFEKNGAPPLIDTKNMYRSAAAYLTQMGIMNLELRKGLDFVVSVPSGKYTRPTMDAFLAVATYHQTHICGCTYEAPVAPARPAAIGASN